MDAITAQVQALVKTVDEAGRKKLIDSLRNLSYSLETTQDTSHRLLYANLQLPIIRIGCDLKLFNVLTESSTPLTVEAIAQKTGGAPLLLSRLLRYLSSVDIVTETDVNTFTKNNITKTLSDIGIQGGVYHNFDIVNPILQAFPDYLKDTKYQDITDALHTPFQKAQNTDLPSFMWYAIKKPDILAHFNLYMAAMDLGAPTWLDVYPWKEKTEGLGPAQPFFVDVGGGMGHQCIALRGKVPELPNRVIVQDIAATLQQAIKHPGVEAVVQDFFEPQAVKGSKIYYMRHIIHDYPDEKALRILQNTKAALGPDSVILIDDMVFPNTGVHWQATQFDLVMMTALAALERTQDQWGSLIQKAGLKINKVYMYTTSLQDSVIECVPA